VRCRSAAERVHTDSGSVTAEFAAVLPAALLVLAMALMGMQVAGVHLRLQDAVADAARSLGRGDSASSAAALVSRAVPGARLAVSVRDELVCADATAPSAGGALLSGLTVTARSCALTGGE